MILITGANGQLGQVFRTILSTEDAIFKGRELDITDIQALREFASQHKIETIINTAAYTAVDLAETESALAFHINSLGVRNLALISKEFEIKLIHISTDYVFDGTNYKPYNEQDTPNPMSVYGRSKLEGEKSILELTYSAYIIRTSWLYSGFGKNFLTNITRLAQEREQLSIVADQIGTPTYAPDLARAILELIPTLQPHTKHILHYSNQGTASWYDFAYEIVNLQNIDCKLTLSKGEITVINKLLITAILFSLKSIDIADIAADTEIDEEAHII